jgi:hypothetical protein
MLSAAGQAKAAAMLIGGRGWAWGSLSGLRLNGAPHAQMRMEDQHGRLYTIEARPGQGAPQAIAWSAKGRAPSPDHRHPARQRAMPMPMARSGAHARPGDRRVAAPGQTVAKGQKPRRWKR